MYRYKLFAYLYLLSSFILSQEVCEDNPDKKIRDLENEKINCEQLTNNEYDNDRKEICLGQNGKGNKFCPLTCDSCSSLITCKDDKKKNVFEKDGDVYSCKKLQKERPGLIRRFCRNKKKARKLCPLTCNECELKFPSLSPTSSPLGNPSDKHAKKKCFVLSNR